MANPYFNAEYYLANNPDVAAVADGSAEVAEQHYIAHGANEAMTGVTSRAPAPWFDINYYLNANPDLANLQPGELFTHFTAHGMAEGRPPSEMAEGIDDDSLALYALANPDLREAFGIGDDGEMTDEQALLLTEHFYAHGYMEDRPEPLFEVDNGDIPSEPYTLTSETDNLIGTDGDDVFRGDTVDLNKFDVLDGRGGDDTLDLYGDLANSQTERVTIENIETINLHDNPTAVNAALFQDAEEIWQNGDSAAIFGLTDGQVAGFRNTGVDADKTINYNEDAEAAHISLEGASNADINIAGAGLQTLSISGSIAAGEDGGAGTLSLTTEGEGFTDGIETLNLAMATDTILELPDPEFLGLKTVDGRDSIASLVTDLDSDGIPSNAMDIEMIWGGSGDDTISLNTDKFGAERVDIDAGDGDDNFNVVLLSTLGEGFETDVYLQGGSGADVFTFTGGNLLDAANQEFIDTVTINDFGDGNDLLRLEGFDGFSAQNAVDYALRGAESLYDAVVAVSGVASEGGAGGTNFAKFNYEGDTYVYGNVADGEGVDGDMLVKLSGDIDLNNDNVLAV